MNVLVSFVVSLIKVSVTQEEGTLIEDVLISGWLGGKSMENFLDVGRPRSLWAVLPLDTSPQEV